MPAKSKPAMAVDVEKLASLAQTISGQPDASFVDLHHRLETEEGLKLAETPKGSSLWKATMYGITATSTAGPYGAVSNWANAARRVLLDMGAVAE